MPPPPTRTDKSFSVGAIANARENLEAIRNVEKLGYPEFAELFGYGSDGRQFKRILEGKSDLEPRTVRLCANVLGISAEELLLRPDTFKRDVIPSYILRPRRDPGGVFVSFQCTRENRSQWERIRAAYAGRFFLYYRRPTVPTEIVVSLLEFADLTQYGIAVNLINPYRAEYNGSISHFEYAGLMLPVGNLLYVFAEQTNTFGPKYEILSLILRGAAQSRPDMLTGRLTGVNVRGEQSRLASCECVAVPAGAALDGDWNALLGNKLDVLSDTEIPRSIVQHLPKYPVAPTRKPRRTKR